MWRSSFLVNLQACRLIAGNFTNIWTPSQIFFNSILPPPPQSPLCIDSSPPMFSTPVGSPGISAHWGDGKFCWEGNFYVVVGIWGGVIFTMLIFFNAKKQHIVKIPPRGGGGGLQWNFAGRIIFFTRWWKFKVRGQVIGVISNFERR